MDDVVIVGAGPAGSAVAIGALKTDPDLDITIYDKRKQVGVPVQCAGAIVKFWLDQAGLEVPDKVICNRIKGAQIHGPNGGKPAIMQVDGDEPLLYVTHRHRFDLWLADMAQDLGAKLVLGHDPSKTGYRSTPRYLIGADGWRSQLGRKVGITRALRPEECHQGVEYRVILKDECDPSYIHLYLGREVAPKGYVWIFPESKDVVKIGIGTPPGHRPRKYLDRFIEDRWGDKIHRHVEVSSGGIIPTTGPEDMPWTCMGNTWVVLVGDAARQTDPLHGGGIANGILAGLKLGEIIGLDAHPVNYQNWLDENIGKILRRRSVIKDIFIEWDDDQLQSMIDTIAEVPMDKDPIETTKAYVKRLIMTNPMLFSASMIQYIKKMYF